jgi:hypothetical protein
MSSKAKIYSQLIKLGDVVSCQLDEECNSIQEKPYDSKRIEKLSIYSGLSGTLLFIIELYRFKKKPYYKQILSFYGQFLIKQYELSKGENNSLMHGHSGIAYTLLQIYSITGNEIFIVKAIEILKLLSLKVHDKSDDFSFFDGIAGEVWVLLQFYKRRKDDWIGWTLSEYLKCIINNIEIFEGGFTWRSEINRIKPLCGLGHGNSGIAFVFIQLGIYFNNECFKYIAQKALEYEDSKWDKQHLNWPDFRKEISNVADQKKYIKEFNSGNKAFFKTPSFNSTFEHGSAGILISHLYSKKHIDYSSETILREAINQIIIKISSIPKNTFIPSLNYGHLGEASAILYAHQLGYKGLLKPLDKFVQSLLEFDKHLDAIEDFSLLSGKAGLGYFLLLFLERKTQKCRFFSELPTIKYSKTENYKNPIFKISLNDLLFLILKKSYPRTYYLLRKYYPINLNEFPGFNRNYKFGEISNSFNKFHSQLKLPHIEKEIIRDIFKFERLKNNFFKNCDSYALLYVHQLIKEQNKFFFTTSLKADFKKCSLIVDKMHIKFITTRWKWEYCSDNMLDGISHLRELDKNSGEYNVILLHQPNEVLELNLSSLEYFILSIFYDGYLVSKGIRKFVTAVKKQVNWEISKIQETAVNIIVRNIINGTLIKYENFK